MTEPRGQLGLVVRPRCQGDATMIDRDDLGARYVPAIDWFELFIWAALIIVPAAGAALLIR